MRALLSRLTLAAAASALLAGCGQKDSNAAAVKQVRPRPTFAPRSPSEWRAELRAAYRLAPDGRFLLAFGEIDRLGGKLPSPPGNAPAAAFADGRWTIRLADGSTAELPELPDFPDYFGLLVAHAKKTLPARAEKSPALSPRPGADESAAFLMPGLVEDLRAAERSLETNGSYREAARAFARVAFQMPDRLEIAPLIPARALALAAAARSRDANAAVPEEILLAHALGYTHHAESLAARLRADDPLHAFEAADEASLARIASQPGASEEARFLAVMRSTSHGQLSPWKEARNRYMPGNDSVAVIATGLDIDLPRQAEVSERKALLNEALPRAVIRDLGGAAKPPEAAFLHAVEFRRRLEVAAGAARGPLWDADAVRAYFEAAFYSAIDTDRWKFEEMTESRGTDARLRELVQGTWTVPPNPRGDTRGAGVVLQHMNDRYQTAPSPAPRCFVEIRALVRWLDSRPRHRWELASYTRYQLWDPRAAEDLYRSLDRILGDGSREWKAESARYLGDWGSVHRLLGSPDLTAPEATAILWSWYGSGTARDELEKEYDRAIDRYPHDWDVTSTYTNLLRDRKQYDKACEIVELWLARNLDPKTPGRFHAHIRLAHNYVLAGRYEKGLKLLDGMTEPGEFQNGNRYRGIAECLAGMGRLDEAEAMSRKAIAALPDQSEALFGLVEILWMRGKDGEAAAILAKPGPSVLPSEVCTTLSNDFPRVFSRATPERILQATGAIEKKPELSESFGCISRGLAEAGRWKEAFRVAEQRAPAHNERYDRFITEYGYLKHWKGPEAAAAWLKEKIPPADRNPLSMNAIYTKNFDVLWDVIETPTGANHPDWVWILRAAAFAQKGSATEAHREQLSGYYAKESSNPYDIMGRYVMGLGSEADMSAVAAKGQTRSEVSYYLAARAQKDEKLPDACDWYRVAAESNDGASPRTLALYVLSDWSTVGLGISKVPAALESR